MPLIYDISNYKNALLTLEKMFGISANAVTKFLSKNKNFNVTDIKEFIKYFNISIDNINIDNAEIVALHRTTNGDKCESIRKHGLCNLKMALMIDSPLKLYLSKNGIDFDIDKELLYYKKEEFSISYNNQNYESPYHENVCRKIYSDYQIEGFTSIERCHKYGSAVDKRPEIIYSLEAMLKMPNLEKQWEGSNNSYIIKYKAPIASYEYNSFYGSLYESEDDLEKNDLKTWMIINAIKVVNAKICNTKMAVTIMHMKKDIVIAPDNILEITECK